MKYMPYISCQPVAVALADYTSRKPRTIEANKVMRSGIPLRNGADEMARMTEKDRGHRKYNEQNQTTGVTSSVMIEHESESILGECESRN